MRKVSTCTSPCLDDQRVPRAASRAMRHQLGRQSDADAGGRIDHHAPAEFLLVRIGGGDQSRAFGRRQHAGDFRPAALLEILDRGQAAARNWRPRPDSRPTKAAPVESSAARPAGCRRKHRARPWMARARPSPSWILSVRALPAQVLQPRLRRLFFDRLDFRRRRRRERNMSRGWRCWRRLGGLCLCVRFRRRLFGGANGLVFGGRRDRIGRHSACVLRQRRAGACEQRRQNENGTPTHCF